MADKWIEAYYEDVDRMRIDDYLKRHTSDVVVQFANNPPARGAEEVRQNLTHFWSMIGGLKHNFVNVFPSGDTTVVELVVDYTRKDGKVAPVPCTTLLHRRGELVDSVRIYLDLAPVFSPQ